MPALKYWDGSAWQYVFPVGGVQAAGGELSGFFPNPKLKPKLYTVGNLPIVGEDGEIAIIEYGNGPHHCLGRYDASVPGWVVIGQGREIGYSAATGVVAAGTGWRKPPSSIPQITYPYAGVWQTRFNAAAQYSAADPQCGCGISKSTDSGTASPTLGFATSSAYVANARVPLIGSNEIHSVAAANDIWDMRFYSSVSNTISPVIASMYARPIRLTGLV